MTAHRLQRLAAVAAIALAVSAGSVRAQSDDDAVTRANRGAYAEAVKCFFVGGVLKADAKEKGKAELVTAYDTKARRSFDFAVQLGEKVGLTGEHITQDFGLAQAEELPKMLTDTAYFRRALATCKTLGLM